LTSTGTIELLGILAVGRHGVLAEEQRRGQPFEVDLRMHIDITKAAASDQLDDTIDYGLVAEAVVRTVELESFQLLERLADRIAGMCLSAGPVLSVEVTVRKLRPPVPVQVRTVGVTVRRDAAEIMVEPDDGDTAVEEIDEEGRADVGVEIDDPADA
jgi:dihydroneopterin aldolase